MKFLHLFLLLSATIVHAMEGDVYLPQMQQLINSGRILILHNQAVDQQVTASVYYDTSTGASGVFYQVAGSQYVIFGDLLSSSGANLTDALTAMFPSRDYSQYRDTLSQLTTVTTGNGSGDMFVVYDPECGACKEFVALTKALELDVTIHWVIVGLQSETGWRAGSALLQSKNPALMIEMLQNPLHVQEAARSDSVDPKDQERIEANSKLLRDFDLRGTPTLILLQKDQVFVRAGMPTLGELKVFADQAQDWIQP